MDQIILLRRAFSFRKPSIFIIGLGYLTACIVAAYLGILGGLEGRRWDFAGIAIGVGLILIFGLIGAWLIQACLTRHTHELIISDEGIRYGQDYWRWSDIQRLSTRQFGNRINLVIQLNGALGRDIHLTVDEMLSSQEYEHLVAELKNVLGSNFSSAVLGEDCIPYKNDDAGQSER